MNNRNSDCRNSDACNINLHGANKCIKCEVKNCVYHSGDTSCTADQIFVGPRHAETSADTICATFKQKENG